MSTTPEPPVPEPTAPRRGRVAIERAARNHSWTVEWDDPERGIAAHAYVVVPRPDIVLLAYERIEELYSGDWICETLEYVTDDVWRDRPWIAGDYRGQSALVFDGGRGEARIIWTYEDELVLALAYDRDLAWLESWWSALLDQPRGSGTGPANRRRRCPSSRWRTGRAPWERN